MQQEAVHGFVMRSHKFLSGRAIARTHASNQVVGWLHASWHQRSFRALAAGRAFVPAMLLDDWHRPPVGATRDYSQNGSNSAHISPVRGHAKFPSMTTSSTGYAPMKR
jgi:hypothetical protein